MPKLHTMELQVVFPNTGVPVRDMLAALAAHLCEDAERYIKTNPGIARDHPALVDKTDMSEALADLVTGLADRSKARWAAFNRRKTCG